MLFVGGHFLILVGGGDVLSERYWSLETRTGSRWFDLSSPVFLGCCVNCV